ncbi:MAG: carbohydrate ABC transporter permease [Solirubrobacteraceae bacterium]
MTLRFPSIVSVLATLAGALFLAPFVVIAFGALQPAGIAAPTGLDLLPLPPSLGSLEDAFALEPLERQLLNSLLVAAIAVPLSVLVASWAGFGMLLLGERWRGRAVGFALVLLVVPLAALWVPRFVLFDRLDVIDTPIPLIAPALMGTTTFSALLLHWRLRSVPAELFDAGRLAGLGPFALWRQVGEPLTRPTAYAVGALVLALHWGNFVDPLLYLFSPDRWTLPLGLRSLYAVGVGSVSVALAGALVAVIPPLLAFALTQRRILEATRSGRWWAR